MNTQALRASNSNLLLLFITLLASAIACKNPKRFELQEAGGIDLSEFEFGLTKDYRHLMPSIFKVCRLPGIYDCASSFVVSSEDGLLLSAGHLFLPKGETHRSIANSELDQVGKKVLVSAFDRSSSGVSVRPQVFDFEVVEAYFESGPISSDIAILKVSPKDLTRFQRWSFPLQIAQKPPEEGKRIFMASFPDPYYRPDYEKKLESFWASQPDNQTSLLKTNRVFKVFDGGFMVTTGIFSGAFGGRLRSARSLNSSTNRTQLSSDVETSAIDSSLGSSGGPWLNLNGEVFAVYTAAGGKPEGKRTGKLENTQFDLHFAVGITDSFFSKIKAIESEFPDFEARKIALREKAGLIAEKLELEASALKSYTNKMLGKIVAKNGKNKFRYRVYSVKNPSDNFFKRTKPYQSVVYCSTMAPIDESILKIYEVEIILVDSEISQIRYKVPYMIDSRQKGWVQSIFAFGNDEDDENGWSPTFTIPTSHLLGNVRYLPQIEEKIGNVDAEGFSWLLYEDSAFDFVSKGYFFPSLLNEVLKGVLQDSSGGGDDDAYGWSLIECSDRISDFFQEGVKWFEYDWIVESRKRWEQYENRQGIYK